MSCILLLVYKIYTYDYVFNRHKMWNVDFEQIENRQELVTLKPNIL